MEAKQVQILNMDSIPRKNWEYIMELLKEHKGPMDLESINNRIFDDLRYPAEFRKETIVYLLECPSSSSARLR